MPRGRGKGRPAGSQSRGKGSGFSETSESSKKDCVGEVMDLDVNPEEGEILTRKNKTKDKFAKSVDAGNNTLEKDDMSTPKDVPKPKEPFDPFALYPEDENSCAQDPYADMADEDTGNRNIDVEVEERLENARDLPEPVQGDRETSSHLLSVEKEKGFSQGIPDTSTIGLTTIDVSLLGLGCTSADGECPVPVFVGNGNVGSEVEIDSGSVRSAGNEFKQPKRRGRKPKGKPGVNGTGTTTTRDRPSQFPFPQSIVNGMVSIDMSNLKIKTAAEQEAIENQRKMTLQGCGGVTIVHNEGTKEGEDQDVKPFGIAGEIKDTTENTGSKKGRKGFKKFKAKVTWEGSEDSENTKKPKALKGKNLMENPHFVSSSTDNAIMDCGSGVASVPTSVPSKGRRGGKRTTVKTEKDANPSTARLASNVNSGSDTEELFDFVEDEALSLDMMVGFENVEIINVSRLKSSDFRIEEIDGEQNYFRRLAPGVQESVAQRAQEISIRVLSTKELLKPATLPNPVTPASLDENNCSRLQLCTE